MYYSPTIISLIEVVLVLVPALVGVAYVTIAERKTMASMQRRLGPNQTGQIKIIHNMCINKLYFNYPFTNYINNPFIKYINYFSSCPLPLCFPNYTNIYFIRQIHTSNYYLSNNKNILNSLYENRLAPVIPFSHPTLITCDDIFDQTKKNEFFSKLSDLIIEKKR